jgi:O-antigen ligase
MNLGERPVTPRMADWCGWVLAGLFALTPLLAWLGPLGFAPAVAIAGLLTLPVIHVRRDDWAMAVAALVLIAWAVLSTAWSPFKADDLEEQTGLKLFLQAPLYWSVVCAARSASPRTRTLALKILSWGLAGLAAVLTLEALTGAALYQLIKAMIGDYDPARWDLARRNVAQGAFVLALLWAPASLAGLRADGPGWLPLIVLLALTALGFTFGADAPMMATALGLAAAVAVIRWPRGAPRTVAIGAGVFFLLAPWLVLAATGLLTALRASVGMSWGDRIGYWTFAAERIAADPMRGWGLDASRMFTPGIRLHPHDAALQVWLELGLIGALAAAIVWGLTFARISRERPGLIAAAQMACAVAYFIIGAVSFGVWQEWWLALGALAAAACAAVQRQPAAIAQAQAREKPTQPSRV